MQKSYVFRLSCLLSLFSCSLFGTTTESLQPVNDIVKKLVEYHIDATEIHEDILVKSFATYINNFDPAKVYLLKKDIINYLEPKSSYKKNLLKHYNNRNFSDYKSLNDTIKISIPRARRWRKAWLENAEQTFQEALEVKSLPIKSSFTDDLKLLEEKHKYYFLSIVSGYIKDSPENKYKGKESKLLKLCHKLIESHENDYLCLQEDGKNMTTKDEEKHISVKIIKSIANSLDAHTAYFSETEASALRTQLEKGMCGIGIILKEDIEGILIKDVVPQGPAHESHKVLPNDILKSVNGQSIDGMSFSKVLEILKGPENSTVVLDLEHSKPKKRVEVKITRKKIILGDKRVDVSSEPFANGIIGKINLHSFYEGENNVSSELDLKKSISELQEKNMLGLILDLRENSGGFLSQAVKVSGLFMTNGVVVISRYSDGSVKYYRTFNGNKFYDGPLVILISKNTASASEIVAQTLQDYGIGIIVGDQQTYGKGTVQHQTITGNFKNEPLFKVTVGRYYTVSGKSTQIEGVKSDISVPSKYSEEEIGERYLDNPLLPDSYSAAFEDSLSDINPTAKKWFKKYYVPNLQVKEDRWTTILPNLVINSKIRLENNRNYENFLSVLKNAFETTGTYKEASFGSNDLQMEESVNIIKDMILLSQIRPMDSK
ncbi:MAG: S41 family peptidase [Victivallaceae bacterium]